MCSSRKKSIPTPWKVIGNSWGGGGVLKAITLEAKCEAKLEFPGGGVLQKKTSGGWGGGGG